MFTTKPPLQEVVNSLIFRTVTSWSVHYRRLLSIQLLTWFIGEWAFSVFCSSHGQIGCNWPCGDQCRCYMALGNPFRDAIETCVIRKDLLLQSMQFYICIAFDIIGDLIVCKGGLDTCIFILNAINIWYLISYVTFWENSICMYHQKCNNWKHKTTSTKIFVLIENKHKCEVEFLF